MADFVFYNYVPMSNALTSSHRKKKKKVFDVYKRNYYHYIECKKGGHTYNMPTYNKQTVHVTL